MFSSLCIDHGFIVSVGAHTSVSRFLVVRNLLTMCHVYMHLFWLNSARHHLIMVRNIQIQTSLSVFIDYKLIADVASLLSLYYQPFARETCRLERLNWDGIEGVVGWATGWTVPLRIRLNQNRESLTGMSLEGTGSLERGGCR